MRGAIVLSLLAALPLFAQDPNFKRSTISANRTATIPLDTIDYTLTIRNDGGRAPNYLLVALPIPSSTLFVGAKGWTLNENDRRLEWTGRLEPGAVQTLTHTFVVKPDGDGTIVATRVDINFDGAYDNLFHDLDVGSAPSKSSFGVTGCGLAVLVHLGMTAVAIFATRRRFLPGILLISLSLGFMMFFVVMGLGEARFAKNAKQTTCTVLDSLAHVSTTRSTSGRVGQRDSKSWTPHFAVRYPTETGEQVSVTVTQDSGLTIGTGAEATFEKLAELGRGATTACWYDPADPKRVLLTKSPGGAYFFALIPLATLALGIWLLRRT